MILGCGLFHQIRLENDGYIPKRGKENLYYLKWLKCFVEDEGMMFGFSWGNVRRF